MLNSLGNILHDSGQAAAAVESYGEALALLDGLEGYQEMKATVMTNLGGCLVEAGSFDQGMSMLRTARTRAQQSGYRRVAALAVTRSAEAWRHRGRRKRARELLIESDALASRVEGSFHDILFLNAYHRWRDRAVRRGKPNGRANRLRTAAPSPVVAAAAIPGGRSNSIVTWRRTRR